MSKANQPGCPCCCAATINVPSISCGGTLTGVLFELLDSAGTTVLQSSTGSSASFAVVGAVGYRVRVSKTGYRTITSSVVTPACGATQSVTVSTWPSTYSLSVHVDLHDAAGNCPASGAVVTISGDGSGVGTTNGSGDVTISLSSSSTSQSQSLSYSIAPPSGSGAATKTGTFTVNACGPAPQSVTLIPDASHVAVLCNSRYLPTTLTWTDDYGTCTLTYLTATTWSGSYTYNTTGINTYTCSTGGFPPTVTGPYADQAVSTTITCYFSLASRGSCASSTFTLLRRIWVAESTICATSTWRCQPLDDSLSGFFGTQYDMPPTADVTASCSTSLSFAFTVAAQAASNCAVYAETAVNVLVTGTI